MCLAQGQNTVRLELGALLSRVKHSTTESLRSQISSPELPVIRNTHYPNIIRIKAMALVLGTSSNLGKYLYEDKSNVIVFFS